MRTILVIAVVLVSSLVALRKPAFGMLAVICFGFLNPHSFTWGAGKTFPIAQLATVGTIIGYIFWQEQKRFPVNRESVLLLSLWIVFGVSTLFAMFPEGALDYFLRVSKVFVVVCLALAILHGEERLKLFAKVMAISIGLLGLKAGLFAVLSGGRSTVFGPEGTYLANSNAIGLALAVNVPLLYYLSREESHKWLRLLLKVMLVFSYPAVICTFSRGAWLGLAAATGLIVLRSKRRFLIISIACICLVFASPLLLMYLPQNVADRFDALVNYESSGTAQERVWSWEFCKRVGLGNPFLGAGFDFVSPEVYAEYYPEHLAYWSSQLGREAVAWSCHNSWLIIFAEHGAPGILILVALLGSCFLSLRSIRMVGRRHTENKWLVSYANMIEAAIVAYMITGTFIDASYYDLLYYLVAMTVIMKDVIQPHLTVLAPSPDALELSRSQLNPRTPASFSA